MCSKRDSFHSGSNEIFLQKAILLYHPHLLDIGDDLVTSPPPPLPWGPLRRQVTARLQITEFPIFSLLPAGMGEPTVGRFEEDAKNARAEMRRKAALHEIDQAKEQQAGSLKFPSAQRRGNRRSKC